MYKNVHMFIWHNLMIHTWLQMPLNVIVQHFVRWLIKGMVTNRLTCPCEILIRPDRLCIPPGRITAYPAWVDNSTFRPANYSIFHPGQIVIRPGGICCICPGEKKHWQNTLTDPPGRINGICFYNVLNKPPYDLDVTISKQCTINSHGKPFMLQDR